MNIFLRDVLFQVRQAMSNNGKNKQNTLFSLYLDSVSVWNSKKQNPSNLSMSNGITFNTNDYYLIKVRFSEVNYNVKSN